jgi:hypothetical protein
MPNYLKENRAKILLQVDIIIQTVVIQIVVIFLASFFVLVEPAGWNGMVVFYLFSTVYTTISTFLLIFWQTNKSLLAKSLSIIKVIFALINLILAILFLIFLSRGIGYYILITSFTFPFSLLTFYTVSVLNFIILTFTKPTKSSQKTLN